MRLPHGEDHHSGSGTPAPPAPKVRHVGGPATLDLTAAAALVVIITADPIMSDLAKTTARNVWACLTGLEGEAALAYAREVAAHQTTAILPPF